MNKFVLSIWHFIRSFALIYLALGAGNMISPLLPIMIPGSILGMLVLFGLLASQVLPADWVKPGCNLMIRYMVMLFVPICVGIMTQYDLLVSQFGPIIISCVVSTLITMLVVLYTGELFQRRASRGQQEERP